MPNDKIAYPHRPAGTSTYSYFRLILGAVILCSAAAVPAAGQTGAFSSVYTESWIDGLQSGEHDELQPVTPVVVGYSVGQMAPDAPDQSISVHTSLVPQNKKAVDMREDP